MRRRCSRHNLSYLGRMRSMKEEEDLNCLERRKERIVKKSFFRRSYPQKINPEQTKTVICCFFRASFFPSGYKLNQGFLLDFLSLFIWEKPLLDPHSFFWGGGRVETCVQTVFQPSKQRSWTEICRKFSPRILLYQSILAL